MKHHKPVLFSYLLWGWTWLAEPLGATDLSKELSLQEAQKLALSHASELKELDFAHTASQARIDAIDGAYDARLESKLSYLSDKQSAQARLQDRTQAASATLGVSKLWSSGASTRISAELRHSELDLPPSSLPPGFSSPFSFEINPEYQGIISFELRQPLWRGWMNRELDLNKQVASEGLISSEFSRKILSQAIASEVEQLAITLHHLHEQLRLARLMHTQAKRFHQKTKAMLALGRADEVDAASAWGAVVQADGQVLGLEIAIDETRLKLARRVTPETPSLKIKIKSHSLSNDLDLGQLEVESFFREQVLQNRLDLDQLRRLEGPILAELDLVKERHLPSLDAFAQVGANGLDDGFGSSLGELGGLSHNKFAIGLELKLELSQTASKKETLAARSRLSALQQKRRTLEAKLHSELSLIWHRYQAANKTIRQAEAQIRSVHKEIELESKRFAQARSDERAKLRFGMDHTRALLDKARAQASKHTLTAQLKHLRHGY